ncbi:MAG: hypothetical protein AB8B51_10945 [Sedimentitalea sp.]
MLTFTPTQMDAFRSMPRAAFVAKMKTHLNRFFPSHCEALDEDELVEAIEHGIKRAKSYKIESQRDVCLYIDLMFAFGRDFDRDKALPWVRDILSSTDTDWQSPRIDRLHKRALAELARAGS